MLNNLSKSILFLFAYLPLIIILLVQNMALSWNLLYISAGLLVVSFILVKLLFVTIKTVSPRTESFNSISNKNSDLLSFIVTYILPFGITFTSINNIISFIILFAVIFYLYIETSLFCVNPLLKIFFGYNIYLINLNKKNCYLLSKKDFFNGKNDAKIVYLTNNLVVEVEK